MGAARVMIANFIPAAGLMFLISCTVFGQSVPSLPTFEVTSVKPVRPGDARGSTFQFTPGGGLKVTNGTLKGIIEMAYDVWDFQISGGPGWLSSQPWDISASSASDEGMSETRRRLQALLAQRFQLQVHAGSHWPLRKIRLSTRLDTRFRPMPSVDWLARRSFDLYGAAGKTWTETGIDKESGGNHSH